MRNVLIVSALMISYSDIRKRCLKADEADKPIYARLVTHTFSTLLVWLFQGLSVSPNVISCVALLVGFSAIPFFLQMTPVSVLIGALIIELYYILDAIDGQWARLKDKKSLTGAFLDYLSNYAIHLPILFAIGVGLFKQTDELVWIYLGFSGGFSALWVILIWNLRASVLLEHLKHLKKAPAASKYGRIQRTTVRASLPKALFGWLHQSLIFPWFMHVLTIVALLACFSENIFFFVSKFLLFYGIGGPLIAIVLTAHWILSRRLDNAPEIG